MLLACYIYIGYIIYIERELKMARKKNQGSKWITKQKRYAIYFRDGFKCIFCERGLHNGIILTLDNNATGNTEWQGLTPDPSTSKAPWKVYNIGANNPVNLLDFIIGQNVQTQTCI